MHLGVLLVLGWHVLEPDPRLSVLDGVELGQDLLLCVTCLQDCLPKLEPLVQGYLTVLVHIHGVKQFSRADLAELRLPVVERFFLVDVFGVVNVEYVKAVDACLLRRGGEAA